MFDGNRGWMFDSDPRESILMEWVEAAFGFDEVSRAMVVPADVRARLYGPELFWGPASKSVVAFIAALDAASAPLGDAELFAELVVLSNAETADGIALREWIGNTLVYCKLREALYAACPGLQGLPWEVMVGVSIVLWLLNAQYLLGAADAAGEDALVMQVNSVLARANLPALGGAFALDESRLPA